MFPSLLFPWSGAQSTGSSQVEGRQHLDSGWREGSTGDSGKQTVWMSFFTNVGDTAQRVHGTGETPSVNDHALADFPGG